MQTKFFVALLCLFPCLPLYSAKAAPKTTVNSAYATKITPENAAHLIRHGPDAIGGIDDWFITNGTICAIVSGLAHESEFSTKGGSLIDLGFCDRADDHFAFTHDLLQGSRRRPIDSNDIRIDQQQGVASIVVQAGRESTRSVTTYSLSREQPTELHIHKKISTTEDSDFNFLTLLNFNLHSLEPFVFNSRELKRSNGFAAEDFASRGVSAMDVAARNADTIITISPPDAEHGIAYGWHLASAERVNHEKRYDLPRFALADDTSNAMLVLSDTYYLGSDEKIDWLQLPQIPLLSLDQDSAIETKEIIFVGKHGDVASITDQILVNSQVVSGKVNEANSAIHVFQKDGTPLTHVRPNANGDFSFKAPSGEYFLRINGSAKRSLEHRFNIGGKAITLEALSLPAPARLELPRGTPMRLVFVGLDGTPNPDFTDQLTGFSVMEEDGMHFAETVSNIFLAGIEDDRRSVELAPGKYRVYATRGPEYSLETTEFSISDKQDLDLNIAMPRQVITSKGFIASDLHVHSGSSFDNSFSDRERVRSFVAESGEVLVSSEHDVASDFEPQIRAMGVAEKIVSIPAVEITSLLPTELNPHSNGHANFFPYPPSPYEYRRGIVNHEDQRWREVIDKVRQKHPNAISQLNHARLTMKLSGELPSNWQEVIEDGHFLDHMGSAAHPYNPDKPLHSHPNRSLLEADTNSGLRDIDFDLMEIINPGGQHHQERIQALRKDWLSFIKQGEKIVGTANSDSHGAHEQVAIPRTMVAMGDDRVTHFKLDEFLQALKNGHAYGTTGPMIEISLSGTKMGETFSGDRAQLSLMVQSVAWIPFDRVKIQVNGRTVDEYSVKQDLSTSDTRTHSLLIPLEFNKDSFVTIEVLGPATKEYEHVYPGLAPYAFSNPIYVDFDGDGKWQAPGL